MEVTSNALVMSVNHQFAKEYKTFPFHIIFFSKTN